jgi:DNA-binding NtrC family response regulator
VVERAVILGDPDAVAHGDLTGALWTLGATEGRSERAPVALEEAKRRFEREYLIRLLARYNDDLRAAAVEADLHPKSLERLIRRHGLRKT